MSGGGLERRRIIVRGRVQGVGFRWFVQDVAADIGVSGWVRNLPDGRSVEALAEGTPEQLDRLAARMRQGPPGSHVGELETVADGGEEPLSGFGIKRA